jgi:hypothetical protein
MAGFVPAIHVLLWCVIKKDVDARDKPGHDELGASVARMDEAKSGAGVTFVPASSGLPCTESVSRGDKIVNLSELFKRAYWGKVTDAELSEVARMITSGKNEDLYILIQILGRAGSPKYRKIVEPYLRDVGDPQLSALAVQVLCWSWGLASEYRSELVCFLDGVDWDAEGYVRLQTISTVGEYLRENSDIELLQMIYSIFSNDKERPLMRGAASNALCRSEKIEWKDIVPAPMEVDSSTQIDRGILERVERKLRRRIH